MAGLEPDAQLPVFKAVSQVLGMADAGDDQAEVGDEIHRTIREVLDMADPYAEAKQRSTREALALYPDLHTRLQAAEDALDMGVRLAIAGNIIDLGAAKTFDLQGTINRVLSEPLAIDESAALRAALAGASDVLFLADNAGESVFDRLRARDFGTARLEPHEHCGDRGRGGFAQGRRLAHLLLHELRFVRSVRRLHGGGRRADGERFGRHWNVHVCAVRANLHIPGCGYSSF